MEPYAMFTRHETPKYCLKQDRIGFFELVRSVDGASLYFQGDDAALWERNMTAIEHTHQDDMAAMDRSFDFLCEGYDELLAA